MSSSLALLVAALAGCGSSGGGGGGDFGAADGLRLEVRSSVEQGRLGELFAGPDARYVLVGVRLDNDLHQAPVSLAPPLFAVRTADGLELLGLVETELLEQPCRGGTQVAQGGQHECSLAFEVPHEEDVVALVYRPDADTEVIVPFESERCTPCGDDCVDLSSNPDHCGECSSPIGAEQTCEDGVATCAEGLTACGPDCVDTRTDPAHCGECFAGVPAEHVCVDGAARCPDDAPTECGGECADLQTDPRHCGECGNQVQICVDGEPTCNGSDLWCDGACVEIYDNPIHCGECNNVCVGENECRNGDCVTYHTSSNTVATCFGICNSLGLGCSAAQVRYSGPLVCIGGGGGFGYDELVSIGCNDIPEPEYELPYNQSCTFFGEASELRCWCLQP